MTREAVMFSLLRAEVCAGTVSEEVKASLSEEMLTEVYGLAKKHDLAHLVGDALSKLGMLGDNEMSQKFKKAAMQAVYRYVKLNGEYQKICKTLEEVQIPFIPLKGSILRNLYPEPWMRTSCDIDILIHEVDVQRSIEVLKEKLQYKYSDKYGYEYSLFSPSGVHLELHSNTIEIVESKAQNAILEGVWSTSYPDKEYAYKRVMTDEIFYFYHILHMAKHFSHGGCGIRPFLDLWILNRKVEHDAQKRKDMLKEGELLTFAQVAQSLSEVWFSGQTHTELTRKMEAFILSGGVYGNMENMATVQQVKKGGKIQSILYKIFLPYSMLRGHYPILQKHKWLLPFCQVARWFRLLSGSRWKRSLRELKANTEITSEQITSTAELLNQLGL